MVIRWLRVSTKPAPITAVEIRATASTSARARSYARRRSGKTWIWSCRTSPPKVLHLATPGTESRRGFKVQSAKVRSSIGVILSETRPILRRSMVEEVSGVMRGALTLTGNWPAVSASFSASIWRARNTSVPSLKTAVMMESPWMDSERNDSMSPRPFTIASTGRVTSTSTCSGERPGASV